MNWVPREFSWRVTARRRLRVRCCTWMPVIRSWACEQPRSQNGEAQFRSFAGNDCILEAPRKRGAFAFHADAVLCFFRRADCRAIDGIRRGIEGGGVATGGG